MINPNSDDAPKHNARGALPPPEFAWQIGKTAASIAFVNEAERVLEEVRVKQTRKLADPIIIALTREVGQVKSGSKVLTDWVEVENFIRDLKVKRGEEARDRMLKQPDQEIKTVEDRVSMLRDVEALDDYLNLDNDSSQI